MSKEVRDTYLGVDPLVEDLVRTVIELSDENAALRAQIEKSENEEVEASPIENWKGVDFLELFMRLWEQSYGEELHFPYRNRGWVAGKITTFIDREAGINKEIYRKYIEYLIFEDRLTLSGRQPEIKDLWHPKMFKIFLSKLNRGGLKSSPPSNKIDMDESTRKYLQNIGKSGR